MKNLTLKIWQVATAAIMAFTGAVYGRNTNAYTAANQENIENYYKNLENDLRLRAEEEIQQIKFAEKAKLAQEDLFRKNRFFEDNKIEPNDTLLTEEDINFARQRVDEARQEILKNLKEEIAKLDQQKEYAMKA